MKNTKPLILLLLPLFEESKFGVFGQDHVRVKISLYLQLYLAWVLLENCFVELITNIVNQNSQVFEHLVILS